MNVVAILEVFLRGSNIILFPFMGQYLMRCIFFNIFVASIVLGTL
jgi:hypothetical protein